MAVTNYGVNHNLSNKVWSRKLFVDALKETHAAKFIGGSNAVIHRHDDLAKTKGDRIRVGLRMQLSGDGISGDNTLEGNEEALTTYTDDLYIDQLRHAVRSAGRMSEQRVLFSVREESQMGLKDWYKDRIDTWFFNQIAGNTAQTDTKFTGLNTVTAPDSNHIVYPNAEASEASVSSASASAIMKLTWIDYCVEKAKTLSVPIRPIMVNGEEKYVMFLHPYQVVDLRTSTDTGQWLDIQKSAMQGGQVSKNPIFTGALGEYNGVILYENTRVPLAPSQTDVRRAIFCGAQSAVMAFGNAGNGLAMEWREETFDYQNQLGISVGMMGGLKKTIFNSEDFGTLVIPTYAVAHG